MNKFKNEVVLYGLAIGLNRGSMLLFMPPIVKMLGVSQYGIYAYIIAIVYILSPFLSLNSSAGVVREGAVEIEKAVYFEKKIVPFILVISILLSLFLELIGQIVPLGAFVGITIMLACSEALSNILLAHFRAQEKHTSYFFYSLLKVILFITIIFGMNFLNVLSLRNMLISQLLLNFILYFSFSFKILFQSEFSKFPIRPILVFTSLLLPHTLAQWMMNASNRLIVKNLIGEYELGIFSIAFSIASIAMVLNSGISLVIPQHMIKNYKKWITHNHITKFYIYYSLAFVGVFVVILCAILADSRYFNIIEYSDDKVFLYMTYIFTGFYFLGLYYYYSNVLFYFKKSKVISTVTITTSVISVGVTLILTKYVGTLGAAIGSLVTYVLYFVFIYLAAMRAEPKIQGHFIRYLLISLTSAVMIFLLYRGFIFIF